MASEIATSRSSLGPVLTLLGLSVRNFLHGKRFIVLLLLFLAPAGLMLVNRLVLAPKVARDIERYGSHGGFDLEKFNIATQYVTTYAFLANFLLPFMALLLAGSIIRDEQEEQTLTYLLTRPIARWMIYVVKLLAAWLVCVLIVLFGLVLVQSVNWVNNPAEHAKDWIPRMGKIIPALLISSAAYCSLFGFLGLLVRRTLIFGGIYIFLFEIVLANIPLLLRSLTLNYYFQILILNWIGAKELPPWSAPRETPIIPELQEGLIGLGSVILVTNLLAMYWFSTREYRMKTPEGK